MVSTKTVEKKKIRELGIFGAGILCGVVLFLGFIICWGLFQQHKAAQTNAKMSAAYKEQAERIAEINEAMRKVETTVKNMGEGYERVKMEQLYPPLVYSSSDGSKIIYYQYIYENVEFDDKSLAIYEIVDPDIADSSQDCIVDAYNATIYRMENKSYLWVSPKEGLVILFEYEPLAVSDWDIIKMAASVHIPS